MPYRYGYLGVVLLLVLAGFAFWPSYYGRLGEATWPFHLHGVTATVWMLLLVGQQVAIQRGSRALHRAVGRSMLVIVPLFTAAGLMMVQSMTASDRPFATTLGNRLGFIDGLAVVAFAGLCYGALAYRRNVWLHAGYLLVTPLLLVMAVVTRLNPFGYVDRLAPGGSMVEQFAIQFDIASVLVLGAAAALYLSHRRYAAPFVAIAVVTVVQWLAFYWIDALPLWAATADVIGEAPLLVVGAVGFGVGLAAVWLGWRAPRAARRALPTPRTAA